MAEPTHAAEPRTDSSALLMLPLPQVIGLSDPQRRGAACVWCGTGLTAETARDLGERPAPDGGLLFPRSCTPCACKEARRVFALHTRSCRRCTVHRRCEDRQLLHALAVEDRPWKDGL
ncbi:hypothetical protein ACH4F6_38980 [Streptomyces sp. NPDC017936]|uniref:hypothetical protein n=1 Tax=Streptomyces sp. NPDC017936 TaxID=3365016 RepID=UPI003789B750